MSSKKSNVVYVLSGEAVDQETIVRQRAWYEDVIRDSGKEFSSTKLVWNLNNKGNFNFKLYFNA